ncbi:MAG: hypothetical protein ACI9MR_000557 [Myxococcota bacterium]
MKTCVGQMGCALLLSVLIASTTGCDDETEAQMWCGPLFWAHDSDGERKFFEQDRACFLVTLEAADGTNRKITDDFSDAIRISYYTEFSDGSDCLIQGVDANGQTDGLEAVLAEDAGDCTTPEMGTTTRVTQRWHVTSGTLTRTENTVLFPGESAGPAWSLRARIEVARYVFDPTEPDYGEASFADARIIHDGRAEASTINQPAQRRDPACEVDGCYQVAYSGEIVAGDQYQACRDFLAANETHSASLSVTQAGVLVNDVNRYVRLNGSCRFVFNRDAIWGTILDYDTGEALITFDTFLMTPEVSGIVSCRIRWPAALQSVSCTP